LDWIDFSKFLTQRDALERMRKLLVMKVDEVIKQNPVGSEMKWAINIKNHLEEKYIKEAKKNNERTEFIKEQKLFVEKINEKLNNDGTVQKRNHILTKRNSFYIVPCHSQKEKSEEVKGDVKIMKRRSCGGTPDWKDAVDFPPVIKRPKVNLDGIPNNFNPFILTPNEANEFTVRRPVDIISIIFDEDNTLSEISMRGLITEVLTNPRFQEEDFINSFLTIYPYFIESIVLLKTLIVFYISPLNDYKKKENVKNFILLLLKKWIEIHLKLLNMEKGWMDTVNTFIEYLNNSQLSPEAQSLVETIKETQYNMVMPKLVVTKKGAINDLTLLSIGSENIAKQLTLREQQNLLDIPIQEFFFTRWMLGKHSKRPRQAPTLTKYIKRSNNMTFWVASTIVQKDITINQRATIIEFWIDVLMDLYQYNNFSSCSQIFFALDMQSVRCLHKTWGQVNKSHKENLKKVSILLLIILIVRWIAFFLLYQIIKNIEKKLKLLEMILLIFPK